MADPALDAYRRMAERAAWVNPNQWGYFSEEGPAGRNPMSDQLPTPEEMQEYRESMSALVRDVAALEKEGAPGSAFRARVAALLRSIEKRHGGNGDLECPSCENIVLPDEPSTHQPDCALAALLKECEGG